MKPKSSPMSIETTHTPGPWAVDHDAICAQGQHMAIAIGLDSDGYETQIANAARIVACVNACDGISTEFLTRHPLAGHPMIGYASERDALRADNARLRSLVAPNYVALEAENARLREALRGIFAQTAKHSRQWGQAAGAHAFASDPDTAKAFATARAALTETPA